MRVTEKEKSHYQNQVTRLVEKCFAKDSGCQVVSLTLCGATDEDIICWDKHFGYCERGRRLGSVYFGAAGGVIV